MPIIRSSRLLCWFPHWLCRSWFEQAQLCLSLPPGHYSSLTEPYLQHTANQERHDQCGNQHHSRELLMMDIVMLETCWAYKKYNKISSGIYMIFYSLVCRCLLAVERTTNREHRVRYFSISQIYRQQNESRVAKYAPKIVGLVWFWSWSIQYLNLKEITRLSDCNHVCWTNFCGPNQFLGVCNISWDCTEQVPSILDVGKGKKKE